MPYVRGSLMRPNRVCVCVCTRRARFFHRGTEHGQVRRGGRSDADSGSSKLVASVSTPCAPSGLWKKTAVSKYDSGLPTSLATAGTTTVSAPNFSAKRSQLFELFYPKQTGNTQECLPFFFYAVVCSYVNHTVYLTENRRGGHSYAKKNTQECCKRSKDRYSSK